jgi:hypothetical protein
VQSLGNTVSEGNLGGLSLDVFCGSDWETTEDVDGNPYTGWEQVFFSVISTIDFIYRIKYMFTSLLSWI